MLTEGWAEMSTGEEYLERIRDIVRAAVAEGRLSLAEVLERCDGAQPDDVAKILREVAPGASPTRFRHEFRTKISEFFHRLPAPNPELAQWWFNVDTVECVTERMALVGPRPPSKAVCLGAPTIAFGLALRGFNVLALDADEDLVNALRAHPVEGRLEAKVFNVCEGDLDPVLGDNRAALFFADPPWYRKWFGAMLKHACSAIAPGGHVFCSLLPRLTRPSAEQDRTDVVRCLGAANFNVLAVERGCLGYVVPPFEQAAYESLDGFRGVGWRRGDLVHAQLPPNVEPDAIAFDSLLDDGASAVGVIQAFGRNRRAFRVFIWEAWPARTEDHSHALVRELKEYAETVSARGRLLGAPDAWSSEKRGVQFRNGETAKIARRALEMWARGCSREDTRDAVAIYPTGTVVVDHLEELFHLWDRFEKLEKTSGPTRDPEQLDDSTLVREHEMGDDPYRGRFSRDRDRIVWSTSLRKLANKTQVLPATEDDNLRQRLTHSIEVVQLATTIGRALDLNLELIEAGALAHDIGHTPFGHAGEHAIHYILASIDDKLFFNHYEHGVDVVRFLEGPYQFHPGHPGLNLTRGTIDCIFKHIYWHKRPPTADAKARGIEPPPMSLEEMVARSKHTPYLDSTFCHPEGQAVRLADKISYLLSDIADGIRLGAIGLDDLLRCRLFHRAPIDICQREGESPRAVFRRERRNIIKVLMEDAIESSMIRWMRKRRAEPSETLAIDHSIDVARDVGQVWSELQKERLHKFPAVLLANVHAARIVSELVIAFSLMPDLVDASFRESHEELRRSKHGAKYFKYYEDLVGSQLTISAGLRAFLPLERTIGEKYAHTDATVDTASLLLAKDFVASLSDSQANKLHQRFLD